MEGIYYELQVTYVTPLILRHVQELGTGNRHYSIAFVIQEVGLGSCQAGTIDEAPVCLRNLCQSTE